MRLRNRYLGKAFEFSHYPNRMSDKLTNWHLTYNEINNYKISKKELEGIKDIADRVREMLENLEFKEKYVIVQAMVEEVIVTNETVIIKAKIPTLVQNIDI